MGYCDDPDPQCDIVPGQYICKNCYAIDEDKTIRGYEYECDYKDEILKYYKRQRFKAYVPYKHLWHLNEVFNRLQCTEQNQPTNFDDYNNNDDDDIKKKLNGDYSLENVYKKCNRKHMIYIYCMLNNLPPAIIPNNLKYLVKKAIRNIVEVCPSYIKPRNKQITEINYLY
jgi:hypothetical protein